LISFYIFALLRFTKLYVGEQFIQSAYFCQMREKLVLGELIKSPFYLSVIMIALKPTLDKDTKSI